MKNFLLALFGGLIGSAAAMALRVLLPWWMYLGIGVVCCVAILIEIVALGFCIVRNERRMKEVMELVERRNR